MLSLLYPSVLGALSRMGYGLLPVHITQEGRYCLAVKMTREGILAARVSRSLRLYLVPDAEASGRLLGLVTAFPDNEDEPLVIRTPLLEGDALATEVGRALCQEALEIYFFDEQDREWMGVAARVEGLERLRVPLDAGMFRPRDVTSLADVDEAMVRWFGQRSAGDDAGALLIALGDSLYPDDFARIDARAVAQVGGAKGSVTPVTLERDDPGPLQELDIAALLRRVFSARAVHLNPIREDTGKELVDLLCVSDESLLLVQAKDSPNTLASLQRPLGRQRSVVRAHVAKGARQLRGALRHVLAADELNVRVAGAPVTVRIRGRAVLGLLVVSELFEDDYAGCSAPVLGAAEKCKAPCVLVDYTALHLMTMHLRLTERFCDGLLRLYGEARRRGQYPKPRFLTVAPPAPLEER